MDLEPSYDRAEMVLLQRQTQDALRLLEIRPNLSLDAARDIRPVLRAAALGGRLAGGELRDVAATLSVLRSIRTTLARLGDALPALGEMGRGLADCRELETAIMRTVNPQGEVVDGASELLGRLRQEEWAAHQRLLARLEEITGSPQGRQVLQEPFITIRDGRYVLAVKAEMRSQFQGLIHDISGSGATVFMEPLATVELGNAWRELKLAEEREVDRILRQLSALVGTREEEVQSSLGLLARIDLALAKARLAKAMGEALPEILESEANSSRHRILLLQARHPLLTGEVVPISVEIGKEFRALVISGPNTGGKTVALKTIGLLALMAQAGMALPAGQGSALHVFDGVYADIGDEQSIQQSLSTFSSHMGNIIHILEAATPRSLVLLDELGAGTDPQEGSAIGRAVLAHLTAKGITTAVTTHHSELKAFAHATEGIENANVEFDPESLAPTYRLVVGLPGRSNAMAIAERLGLPQPVLQEARAALGAAQAEVEALLAEIQERGRRAERDLAEAEATRRDLQRVQTSLVQRQEELEAEQRRSTLMRQVEIQVQAEEMKSRLRQVSRRIHALVGERGRKELGEISTEVAAVRRELQQAPWQVGLQERQGDVLKGLTPGDPVRVEGLETHGELVAGPDRRGMVEVQMGAARLRVHRSRILGRGSQTLVTPERKVVHSPKAAARAQVGPEFWVHGMRARQAVAAVDEYLEKAAMAGHQQVSIIHGKGRGVLRSAIHRALDDHPLVGFFRDAEPADGGLGVTIVEL